MGIDNTGLLKPPGSHDPAKCGGVGICLVCSSDFMRDNNEIRRELDEQSANSSAAE